MNAKNTVMRKNTKQDARVLISNRKKSQHNKNTKPPILKSKKKRGLEALDTVPN